MKDKRIEIRVSGTKKNKFEELLKENNTNKSEVIEYFIDQYIENSNIEYEIKRKQLLVSKMAELNYIVACLDDNIRSEVQRKVGEVECLLL